MTPVDFAVLWVLNNRTVSSVIAGPRTLEQWNAYLGALKHKFHGRGREIRRDGLVAKGHPATPGLIWSRHPPMGRRPVAG
jgi:aryl-alcohol dehydrogenase-like predicted oxidoreductase